MYENEQFTIQTFKKVRSDKLSCLGRSRDHKQNLTFILVDCLTGKAASIKTYGAQYTKLGNRKIDLTLESHRRRAQRFTY